MEVRSPWTQSVLFQTAATTVQDYKALKKTPSFLQVYFHLQQQQPWQMLHREHLLIQLSKAQECGSVEASGAKLTVSLQSPVSAASQQIPANAGATTQSCTPGPLLQIFFPTQLSLHRSLPYLGTLRKGELPFLAPAPAHLAARKHANKQRYVGHDWTGETFTFTMEGRTENTPYSKGFYPCSDEDRRMILNVLLWFPMEHREREEEGKKVGKGKKKEGGKKKGRERERGREREERGRKSEKKGGGRKREKEGEREEGGRGKRRREGGKKRERITLGLRAAHT
ncbi:Cyclic nucleotide-gated cation channel beta-1, partial [Ophiophagus hannah]